MTVSADPGCVTRRPGRGERSVFGMTQVTTLSGNRQCGKTFLLGSAALRLLQEGKHVAYLAHDVRMMRYMIDNLADRALADSFMAAHVKVRRAHGCEAIEHVSGGRITFHCTFSGVTADVAIADDNDFHGPMDSVAHVWRAEPSDE